MQEKKMKHKVYDSVFNDLFSENKSLLELYRVLIGEKANPNITEKDIELLDSDKVFINDLYNDLSFVVDNEIIVLVEAQNTYSKNIATRLLFYAAKGLEEYIKTSKEVDSFHALYYEKELEIPKIKLYTVYTGSKSMADHDITLSELMTKNNVETDIDLKVKVICGEDKENVLGQYILFCNILREELRKEPKSTDAIKRAIKKCQQDGILEEYLQKRKSEVVEMLAHSITTEDWVEHRYKKGMERGISIGRNEGISIGEIRGMLTLGADIAKITELTGATEEEILEVKKNM